MHALGPEAAVAALQEVLTPELPHLRFWVNRVDLFADWQGWSLGLDDARRFVCRADARRTYEVAGALTGFEFGSRTTKTFLARLYDKTADMAAKDTRWWFEVWGARYVPGTPVHRLEFEVGRQGLQEFDLNTPAQVLAAAGDLWAYATREWLTYRSPSSDRTRSRWPLAPEWRQVQRATLGHDPVGLERLRLARRGPPSRNCSRASPATWPRWAPSSAPTASTTPWGPSGIICTPTRSSATPPSPSGWPGAALNWSCGERVRTRLRAGGGGARADRAAHGERKRTRGRGGQRC